MYQMVKAMHTYVDDRDLAVHCIGHSLGAHGCGFLGKHLVADPDKSSKKLVSSQIGKNLFLKYLSNRFFQVRISGMDPAGPLFCNDVPWPFDFNNIKPTARLNPHDANVVDVIHTDGKARDFGYLIQVSLDYYITTRYCTVYRLQRAH